MRCPECDFLWIDRSSRTVIDKVRDNTSSIVWGAILGGSFFVMIGGLFLLAFRVFAAAVDRRGMDDSIGIIIFFCLCAAAIVVIGVVRFRAP